MIGSITGVAIALTAAGLLPARHPSLRVAATG
jgi:hypothetical protein